MSRVSESIQVSVPEHRAESSARRLVRLGIGPFSGMLGMYYLLMTLFHVVFAPADVQAVLAGATALTASLFLTAAWSFRTHLPPPERSYAIVVLVSSVVLANVSLYQAIGDDPRNIINFALINVVAGFFVLNRLVLFGILVVDVAAFLSVLRLTGAELAPFDLSFLLGTCALAMAMSYVRHESLVRREALALQTEIALDRAERRLEQRDKAVHAHRRSQHGLRKLIETATRGVLIIQGGTIVYANQAFRDLLHRSRDEILGGRLADLAHPDDAQLADPEFIWSEADAGVEIRLMDHTSEPVSVEVIAGSLEYGDGPATMLIFQSEVAPVDRDGLAHRLLAAGTLSGAVVHGMNNPLATALGNLELLQLELEQEQASASTLQRTESAINALLRVRDVVADLADRETSEVPSHEPVSLSSTVDAAVRAAWNDIRHRSRLRTSIDVRSAIHAPRAILRQIFENLLINAAQAIEEGSAEENQITVRASEEGRFAVVEIEDTGTGMPGSMLQQIFEPFFTTKPVGLGTGLGLTFTRSEVENLGGRIEVESTVGSGTLVRLHLPLVRQPPRDVDLGRHEPETRTCRRILIVDDEPTLTTVLAHMLKSDDVVIAGSGDEALEQLADGHWDAILCDVLMPETGGPEVYQALMAKRPDLVGRIAFVTGGTFTQKSRRFLDQISAPVLKKPFRVDAVRALVDQLANR